MLEKISIDHDHIEVKSCEVAAQWYNRVLGLTRAIKLAD